MRASLFETSIRIEKTGVSYNKIFLSAFIMCLRYEQATIKNVSLSTEAFFNQVNK